MEQEKYIDLEKAFRDKNPRLSAWMPRILLNYIRRVVHEEEINAFIAEQGDKRGFDFAEAILHRFDITVSASGLVNIPPRGGFILVANHPLGGLDAISLFHLLSTVRRDLKFIVNDILLQIKHLNELFIGVNKHGKNAHRDLEAINELYASEQAVLLFPAGLVSRRQHGIIRDLEWKKSFVSQARKHRRDVVPVHISGRLTNRFYRLANIRRALGIRANIEMFYLVDELFRQKGQNIHMTIREPVRFETFSRDRSDLEWAAWVRQLVYEGLE